MAAVLPWKPRLASQALLIDESVDGKPMYLRLAWVSAFVLSIHMLFET